MRLNFNIGAHRYKYEIAKEPLFDRFDNPALALFHGNRRFIEGSPLCPPGERLETLLHELRHAWRFHFPPPPIDDEEADADYYASMTTAIITQLMAQGGPGALLALECDVLTDFDPSKFVGTLAERGVDRRYACNVCQQPVGPASVLVTNPRPHPTLGTAMVGLAFYCDHCNHVQHWAEFANAAGNPTGVVCLEPEYMSREETAAFCDEHPEKTTFHPAT